MWTAVGTNALLAFSPIQDIFLSFVSSTILLQDYLLPYPPPLRLARFHLLISLFLAYVLPIPLLLVVEKLERTNVPPSLFAALLHLAPPLHMTMMMFQMTLLL